MMSLRAVPYLLLLDEEWRLAMVERLYLCCMKGERYDAQRLMHATIVALHGAAHGACMNSQN